MRGKKLSASYSAFPVRTFAQSSAGGFAVMASDNWDPEPAHKEYYRHKLTGDLGWLVRRDGRECIRYDRGDFDQYIAVRRDDKGIIDWQPEAPPAPLNDYHVGMIAFVADNELQRHTGDLGRVKKWLDLREEDRHRWIRQGPPEDSGMRRNVYDAIRTALEPYTK